MGGAWGVQIFSDVPSVGYFQCILNMHHEPWVVDLHARDECSIDCIGSPPSVDQLAAVTYWFSNVENGSGWTFSCWHQVVAPGKAFLAWIVGLQALFSRNMSEWTENYAREPILWIIKRRKWENNTGVCFEGENIRSRLVNSETINDIRCVNFRNQFGI